MSVQTICEKLQLKDEKNLLIQGLPSSIEKQFIKLPFAKCVTPLLRTRKIDFALIFAVSKKQLVDILNDVTPALHSDAQLWIAYPKLTSKIASDLSRDANWQLILQNGYQGVRQVALDNVWSAVRFKKPDQSLSAKPANFSSSDPAEGIDYTTRNVTVPDELQVLLKKNKPAGVFFESLSFNNKREYVEWVIGAKKVETKEKRMTAVLEKLCTGKKNPSAK